MPSLPCCVVGVFVGGPKTLVDACGTWQSSIARDAERGLVKLEQRGFVGDRATQEYHGTPELAVCIHSQTHYDFWNATLGMSLRPGAVGENLTFDTWDDSSLCVGDVLRIGTATIQISAPRSPCETQARHVGRADWVKRTLEELRTGIYARVLESGTLEAGQRVILDARPNPSLRVEALNACFYHAFDMGLAIATGHCWQPLAASIPGFEPVPAAHLLLLGVRDLDDAERPLIEQTGVRIVAPAALRDPTSTTLADALAALPTTVCQAYIHLDLDVLDPLIAPANSFPAPAGLFVDDVLRTLALVQQRLAIVAVASYDPAHVQTHLDVLARTTTSHTTTPPAANVIFTLGAGFSPRP